MDRISKLKAFLQESEEDSFLKHALALEYIKTGNDYEARKLFDEILKREPGYIGSYYHLGKLLERIGETEEALKIYAQGMKMATAVNDTHSFNELRAALQEAEE